MAGIKSYRLATFECRVALYAGLCSGFILLYAPAFLSLLSLFERKERIMRICVKRHKAVKGEEKGGERS